LKRPYGGVNPKKTRKGVALVLALVVMVIGGAIIGLTFEFVYRFFWISTEQREIYVDHTTVLSAIQSKIAQIIEHNKGEGKTMHVSALGYDSGALPANGSLSLNDLRFGDPWSKIVETGHHWVETEVFDMHFMADWVDYNVLKNNPAEMKDFPSVFNMAGEVGSGGYSEVGDHTAPGASNRSSGDADELDPDSYGAYLIRVRLYDRQGKLIRTAEEAFVQILPGS
jgi:hypothetical protein